MTSLNAGISELSSYYDISFMRAEIWLYYILFPQFLEQWLVYSKFSVYTYEMNEYWVIFNKF